MRKLLFISFVLLFSFCSKKEKHKYPRIIVPEQKNTIQVNTDVMLHSFTDGGQKVRCTNFDTDFKMFKGYHTILVKGNVVNFKKWETTRYDFKIIIDTSYTLASQGFEYKNTDLNLKVPGKYEEYYDKVFALLNNYVECYPLLIFNNGNNNVYVGNISLIQQARDADGKWKPIEFFENTPSCLPTEFYFKHRPKKYSCIPIIKYHGNFKTKLRVKIRIDRFYYYSNEIDGYINRSQFDKTFAIKHSGLWSVKTYYNFVMKQMSFRFLEDE